MNHRDLRSFPASVCYLPASSLSLQGRSFTVISNSREANGGTKWATRSVTGSVLFPVSLPSRPHSTRPAGLVPSETGTVRGTEWAPNRTRLQTEREQGEINPLHTRPSTLGSHVTRLISSRKAHLKEGCGRWARNHSLQLPSTSVSLRIFAHLALHTTDFGHRSLDQGVTDMRGETWDPKSMVNLWYVSAHPLLTSVIPSEREKRVVRGRGLRRMSES